MWTGHNVFIGAVYFASVEVFFWSIRCEAMLRLVQRVWCTLANQVRGFAISANHVQTQSSAGVAYFIFPALFTGCKLSALPSGFRCFSLCGLVYFARDFPEHSYSSIKRKIRFRFKDRISLGTSNFLPRTFLETIKNSKLQTVENQPCKLYKRSLYKFLVLILRKKGGIILYEPTLTWTR